MQPACNALCTQPATPYAPSLQPYASPGETLDALHSARGACAPLCRRLYRHLVLHSFTLTLTLP